MVFLSDQVYEKPNESEWKILDSVPVFACVAGAPDEEQILDDLPECMPAPQQEDARHVTAGLYVVTQVARQTPPVSAHQDVPVLLNPLQVGGVVCSPVRCLRVAHGRHVHFWLTAQKLVTQCVWGVFVQEVADAAHAPASCP